MLYPECFKFLNLSDEDEDELSESVILLSDLSLSTLLT